MPTIGQKGQNERARLQRSTTSRRALLRTSVAGAAAAGLTLAGCSGSNANKNQAATAGRATTAAGGAPSPATPSGSATRAATASAATSPAAQQPRRGGKIQEPIQFEPPNLDQHKAFSAALTGFGPGSPYSQVVKAKPFGHNGAVIPVGDVAASWEQPDPAGYVFHLRPDVKFQNIAPVNGRTLAAQDVVYSFNREISEKVEASFLAGIKGTTAVDATTLRIDLDGPNADFLGSLCDVRNKIIAHEAVELHGDLINGPVIGSGAWIFKEWQKGVSISLVRNPDYFLPGQPFADELNFFVLTDLSAVEAQLVGGQLTHAAAPNSITYSVVDRYGKDPRFKVYRQAPTPAAWVMVNLDRPEVKDPRVRLALSKSIDRQLLFTNVYSGRAELDAMGMVLPGPDWQLPKDELQKALAYDPKAAQDLLKQAGGLPKLTVPTHNLASTQSIAQLVQANWKAIGVDCDLQVIDSVQLTTQIYDPTAAKFTLAFAAIGHGSTLTADLETWYKTGGARNGMHLSDPQVDSLIAAQKVEFNENKRKDLVHQLQRRILELAPTLSVGATVNEVLIRATMQNFEPLTQITGEYSQYMDVWLSG